MCYFTQRQTGLPGNAGITGSTLSKGRPKPPEAVFAGVGDEHRYRRPKRRPSRANVRLAGDAHPPARHRFVIAMARTRHQRLGTARARAGPSLICCLLAFIFCASASPAQSAPPEPRAVTVGIPQSFPPYYGLDEDGNPVGFAVEVMDAVAERAGFEVTYSVVTTGGDNFEALLAGRIDIIPSLGISEKRGRQVAFTAPVETFPISLFLRDDTQDVRGLDDLAGRVGAVIADTMARLISKSGGPATFN